MLWRIILAVAMGTSVALVQFLSLDAVSKLLAAGLLISVLTRFLSAFLLRIRLEYDELLLALHGGRLQEQASVEVSSGQQATQLSVKTTRTQKTGGH